MNNLKLKQLFAAARRETPPVPATDFAAAVLRVARRETPEEMPAPAGILEQLNGWFPRLALASLMLIVLCVAADNLLTAASPADSGDMAAQFSSQYFAGPETEDL